MSDRGDGGSDDRKTRLAQALRENLKRRKAQGRERRAGGGGGDASAAGRQTAPPDRDAGADGRTEGGEDGLPDNEPGRADPLR